VRSTARRPPHRGATPPALGLTLAALAALLPGCPLPQALPEFPSTGAITPPRIRSDLATPTDAVLEVDPACATAPAYQLSASLVDENTIEPVDARWFVDWRPTGPLARDQSRQTIQGPLDGIDTVRTVTPWTFRPYDYDPGQSPVEQAAFRTGGGLHVVELVVSNGFEEDPGPASRPYRSPKAGFETQVLRWVFHYVPGAGCGVAP
jgi:hypothetical protein